MILNLSDVLSEQHKPIHQSVPIEMTCFRSEMGNYVITDKTPLELSVEYAGDRKLEVTGKAEIISFAPCDRCLEDVEVKVTLDFKHKIDTESDALPVTVKIRGSTLECQLSVMYLRILRRCNLCQFVQRINLLKQEETKEEQTGK